jgi:ABC-type uncharacterized transport system auxiliary subunit
VNRALAVAVLAGCALTRNTPPVPIRQFTPEVTHDVEAAPKTCGALSLGRVSASAHLRYRIAHRTSPVEIELYDTLRWTDHPEAYVRRALERQLFARSGLTQAVAGALVLDVEVLGFEQVDRPRVAGRVQVAFRLRDDRTVLASGVLATTRPASSTQIDAVVAAIGAATEAAAGDVAARVVPAVLARANCMRPP